MRKAKVIRNKTIKPDQQYSSVLVSKLINYTMRNGKKSLAQRLIYNCLKEVEKELKIPADQAFNLAIENVAPTVEVRSRRIGGATYQVPTEIKSHRKINLALRWILQAARSRQGKSFDLVLAEEIVNGYNKTGAAIKKREEMHKSAEANKAFSHFARY